MKAYRDWQKDLFNKWAQVGFWGCLKARTGSGKTLSGVSAIDQYRQMYPDIKLIVVTPSAKINQQWMDTFKEQGVEPVPIYSYQQAINKMYRGGLTADCLILDECHRISPEKQSAQIMKLNPIHVLGLSATPGGSVQTLGKPFYTVDWEEAQLCPFYVHYALFLPTDSESDLYDGITSKMQRRALELTNGRQRSLRPGMDSRYDWMVRERRSAVYEFQSRIPNAINIIATYAKANKRIIVYAERNDTLKAIAKGLSDRNITWSVCSQWMDTLADFEQHRTNVLLLAKKLREGWNDPTLEVEVLVSPTTRELSHTQVVGRVCRQDPKNPNKEAHVFVLIAQGTTDENLVYNNDFPKTSTEATTVEKIVEIAPGLSERKTIRQKWF